MVKDLMLNDMYRYHKPLSHTHLQLAAKLQPWYLQE